MVVVDESDVSWLITVSWRNVYVSIFLQTRDTAGIEQLVVLDHAQWLPSHRVYRQALSVGKLQTKYEQLLCQEQHKKTPQENIALHLSHGFEE